MPVCSKGAVLSHFKENYEDSTTWLKSGVQRYEGESSPTFPNMSGIPVQWEVDRFLP